jgi:diguanylate cyclase (GGDEF)-like protein
MNIIINNNQPTSRLLVKSALVISVVAVVLLTPFSINNFYQGRIALGIGSLAIVILCSINAWNCLKNRYKPLIVFLGLVPCIIFVLVFAFREQGLIGALWTYPAILSIYFLLPERYAWAANAILVSLVFPEALKLFDYSIAVRFVASVLMISIFSGVFIRFISEQQMQLESMVITDPLTGIYNRTTLQNNLQKAIDQSNRMKMPMTLLMLDIDNFKNINDSVGHFAGDEVLRGLGKYFQQRIRRADSIYRVGGEEFIALLYDTNKADAYYFAQAICEEVEALPLLDTQSVTISIGVAELLADDDMNSWMKHADINLYQAKSNGRNQVVS